MEIKIWKIKITLLKVEWLKTTRKVTKLRRWV